MPELQQTEPCKDQSGPNEKTSVDSTNERQSNSNLNWENRSSDAIKNNSPSMMQNLRRLDKDCCNTEYSELGLDEKLNSKENTQTRTYDDAVVTSSSSQKEQQSLKQSQQIQAKGTDERRLSPDIPDKQQIDLNDDKISVQDAVIPSSIIRQEKQSAFRTDFIIRNSLRNICNGRQPANIITSKDSISLQRNELEKKGFSEDVASNGEMAKACTFSLDFYHQSNSERYYDDSSDSTISSITDNFSENQVSFQVPNPQPNLVKDNETIEDAVKDQALALLGSHETSIVNFDQSAKADENIPLPNRSYSQSADKQAIPDTSEQIGNERVNEIGRIESRNEEDHQA